MTESKKHSRRMQSHTGAVNSKVAQFLLRKKATQRKTKGNKVRVEEHQGLQDGEMQEGESGNRLRTLLQDVEANQSDVDATQETMVTEASIDEVVPPPATSSEGDEKLKAELERASWLLRSNEVQLVDALREVDSLDKVLAWARLNQGGDLHDQHPIVGQLMGMVEEHQRQEQKKRVSECAGVQTEWDLDATEVGISEMEAALRTAEESASRKEAALATALARANEQLAGLSKGGERLVADLTARDSEVARLRAELAGREAEIEKIGRLLEGAKAQGSDGRVSRHRSPSLRDSPRRRVAADEARSGPKSPRPSRHPAPFEHMEYSDEVRRRSSSSDRQLDDSKDSDDTPSVVSWLPASESSGTMVVKTAKKMGGSGTTKEIRGSNVDAVDELLVTALPSRSQRSRRQQLDEDYVANISQSARARSSKRSNAHEQTQSRRLPVADSVHHQAQHQLPTASPGRLPGSLPTPSPNKTSPRRRRTTQGGEAPVGEAQNLSLPSSPRAWRSPGCLDGVVSASNITVLTQSARVASSKPPSGISYLDMIQELAEALEGEDETVPSTTTPRAKTTHRREKAQQERSKVDAVTLESMFHLGNGSQTRGDEPSKSRQQPARPSMPKPGNSYSEIFVAKREAQARLAKLQRDYGAAGNLQSRRLQSQSSSRASTPRRHTADNSPTSCRHAAGAARPTADDIISTTEAARRPATKSAISADESVLRPLSPSTPETAQTHPATTQPHTEAFTPRRQSFSGARHQGSRYGSGFGSDALPCAGLLFAGNVWYNAVIAAAAAAHPAPGGAAVALLARWGAVSEEQPKKAADGSNQDVSKTLEPSTPSPRQHRRTVSAGATAPSSASGTATELSIESTKQNIAELVTSESSSTMDSLYKLIRTASNPSLEKSHIRDAAHAAYYAQRWDGKRVSEESCGFDCEGGGEEGYRCSQPSSPRTMGYYVGEDGILHYSSPRSTLDELPSPRLRSPRLSPSRTPVPERTWRPQLRSRSHTHCSATEADDIVTVSIGKWEVGHPLQDRFAQWKRACGWSNLAAVVLHEVRRSREEIHSVSKAELAALRSFTRPPPAVQRTLEALAIILSDGQLPQRWVNVLSLLRSESLKAELLAFEPKSLAPRAIRFLQTRYLNHPNFTFVEVARASHALGPLLRWIKAVVNYGAYRHLWYGQMDQSLSIAGSSVTASSTFLRSSSEASDAGEAAGVATTDASREKELDRWRTALASAQRPPLISPRATPLYQHQHHHPVHRRREEEENRVHRNRAPHVVRMGVPNVMMAAY